MRYYATASGLKPREAMASGHLGQIVAPGGGSPPLYGVDWIADNGAFTGTYPGDDKFLRWLDRYSDRRDRCRFVAAPDVVGDAVATLARSRPMLKRLRRAGYPVALVAQDGLERLRVPWNAFDALFIGGTTEWKLSQATIILTARAKWLGKHVHMGRVNSERRLRYAAHIGCDSADGTWLRFGPNVNLPRLLRTVEFLNNKG